MEFLARTLAAIAVTALLAGPARAAVINVAVIQDNSNQTQMSEVLGQLNDSTAFDFNATEVTQASITSAATLSGFAAIVMGGSGHTTAGWSDIVMQAVADYMSAGGGIVTAGWWHFSIQNLVGTADANAQFVSPALTTGGYDFVHDGTQTITDSAHPITAGVTDFVVSGCCIELPNGVDTGAVSLGTASGRHSIIYQDLIGRSVYLGPNYMSSGNYPNDQLRSGEADQLFEQAVGWAAGATATASAPATVIMLMIGLVGVLATRRA